MILIELEAYRAPYFAMKEYVETKLSSLGYNFLINTGDKWIGYDSTEDVVFVLGRTMSECVKTIDNLGDVWVTY